MTVARTELQSLFVARCTATQGVRLAKSSGTALRYTTTATGAATTVYCTTITDTANTQRKRVIECLTGDNKGHREFITAQTAVGSINTTAFDNSVASGVEFRISDNPYPLFVHDGGNQAGGCTIQDTSRNSTYEGADFWNGDFAECIKGTNITVGKMTEISNYTAAGTLTVGAMGATVADGDMFLIHRVVAFENGGYTPGTNTHDRPAVRATFAPLPPAIGGRSGGELTFSLPVKGDDTGAGDGTTWTRQSAIMPLLETCFGTLTQDQGDAVDGSCTTVRLTGIAADRYTTGNLIMINGNISRITAKTSAGSAVTISPALPDAPKSGDVLYGSATFKRATSNHPRLCFTFYDDLIKHRLWSSLGTVNFSTDAGGRMMANFTFTGQAHDHSATTCRVNIDGSHTPDTAVADIMGIDGIMSINGDAVHCGAVSFDPGIVIGQRASNGAPEGSLGPSVRGGLAKFTCNPLLENASYYDDFYQGDSLTPVYWQSGNEPGNTFVIFAPKGVAEAVPGSEDAEGERRQSLSIRVVQPGSTEPTQDDVIVALI